MLIGLLARFVIAAYFIEIGLLLVVSPWTPWLWQRNFFAQTIPGLLYLMSRPEVQWGVVATGLVTFLAGLHEARLLLFGKGRAGRATVRDESRVL